MILYREINIYLPFYIIVFVYIDKYIDVQGFMLDQYSEYMVRQRATELRVMGSPRGLCLGRLS